MRSRFSTCSSRPDAPRNSGTSVDPRNLRNAPTAEAIYRPSSSEAATALRSACKVALRLAGARLSCSSIHDTSICSAAILEPPREATCSRGETAPAAEGVLAGCAAEGSIAAAC